MASPRLPPPHDPPAFDVTGEGGSGGNLAGDNLAGRNVTGGRPPELARHHVEFVMGMAVSIDIRDPATDQAAITDVVEWLHHVDHTFSTHKPESPISAMGPGELSLDDAGDEIRDVLRLCEAPRDDSGGATSATYERGAHIIDPRIAEYTTDLASVTIVGPDLTLADAYATTVFVMGLDGLDWLTRHPGYDGYVITHDDTTYWTDGFSRYRSNGLGGAEGTS